MSNERYNYSISLIRRRNNSWVIEPKDATSRLFATELPGKKLGDGYLASKIEGELSYCIFLSGGVCHSDVYGWIITMNGWQILELDTYLQLAQEVWNELAQTEVKERDIRQLLYDMAENKELIPQCVPVQMSRNVVENTHIHPFTPTIKPPEPILKKLKKWQPEVVKVAIALVGIFVLYSGGRALFNRSRDKDHIYNDSSYAPSSEEDSDEGGAEYLDNSGDDDYDNGDDGYDSGDDDYDSGDDDYDNGDDDYDSGDDGYDNGDEGYAEAAEAWY